MAMSCVVLAYLNLSIIADCSTNRLARPDTEVVPLRSTENQPKMTEFLLSYFVGEYKIGKPMMQKHLNGPLYCGSPCIIVALSAFAVNMVTTILDFCSCFTSGTVGSLRQAYINMYISLKER